MDNGYESYRRFLDGDDEGIVELMRDYESGLILYINCIVHNIRTAMDISEDIFVDIYVKKPRCRERDSFKAWLYTIGRNAAKNYIRRHRREEKHMDSSGETDDIESREDIEREYIRSEDKIALHRAMMKLGDDYRQALTMVYFEQLSNAEAARVMHKTKRQIEGLLYYGKKVLKNELERSGFDYGEL